MRLRGFLIAWVLCLLSVPALAADTRPLGPLSLRSQNPLFLLFLTPRPERAMVIPAGQFKVSARGPYSNLYEQGFSADTGVAVDLDMELFRPSFLLEYGIAPGWELGVEIPTLHFEGGFLDSFIQGWHDFFGLPNSGRNLVANGRFSYAVRQNGIPLYEVGTQTLGFADLIFHAKKDFFYEIGPWPAVGGTFYLKLPTGDKGEGLGSGAPDLGFNLAVEKHLHRFHGYLNLGAVIFGGSDTGLEPFLEEALWNWMLALEVTLWEPHLALVVQLQGDSSLFHDTGISALDQRSLVLTVGFAGQEGPWGWKIGFAEDPSGSGPAVDFTTYAELNYTWDFWKYPVAGPVTEQTLRQRVGPPLAGDRPQGSSVPPATGYFQD